MLFEIRNEKDLHRAIESVWFGHTELRPGRPTHMSYTADIPIDEIGFVGWPRLDISMRGEKFNGGIPARVMPALYKYQLMLDRAYARTIGADARGLTLSDRKRIELIVGLEHGSTSIVSDLSSVLNGALELMNFVTGLPSREAGLVVLIVALSMAPGVVKTHMREKTKRIQLNKDARMSEQETERIRLLPKSCAVPDTCERPSTMQRRRTTPCWDVWMIPISSMLTASIF